MGIKKLCWHDNIMTKKESIRLFQSVFMFFIYGSHTKQLISDTLPNARDFKHVAYLQCFTLKYYQPNKTTIHGP